jgi:hypothetical protein
VTVTMDTTWGFSRVEVELDKIEVLCMVLEPVERGKIDMDPPGTGDVIVSVLEVVLK